jgi:uncharacterized membrane protein
MKAIRVSPLSLTLPYLAFTPAFMIFSGYVFLNEMPNLWGIAGIVLTCAGGLFFIHCLAHGFAISMVKAGYMISIKRFSVLIGMFYGGMFFKEKYIAVRFAGAGLMVAGAVLITVWGK